ncbi:MAG TPA: UbiA family prenyltransferase [Candidatus Nanoarchaeia archaeon]|nr:UbiA family prenyltransferase [Candidatus Nanoarchaeia archaeon]
MKTDSVIVNLPKNIVQYLIGFSLYLLVYGSFDLFKLIIGLTSFILAYSAIYPYNDLMDYEKDKKDKFKRVYKALVRGDLKQKDAITLTFGLTVTGLLLSTLVNSWYTVLLLVILLQNFLHSAPQTSKYFKLKKKIMIPNMFILQTIKYTLGWFTFTTDITQMPTWIINTLSGAYVYAYVVYKHGTGNMKASMSKNLKVYIPLGTLVIGSYIISLMIYPFKLPIIIIVPLGFLFFTMRNQKDIIKKTFKLSGITVIVMAGMVLMNFLLNVPSIAKVNDGTTDVFEKIGEITMNKMDNETYEVVCQINETLYSYPIRDLKELDNIFNITGKEVIVRNI